MAAKPIKSLELQYTMIQFLIITDIHADVITFQWICSRFTKQATRPEMVFFGENMTA